MIFVQTDKSFDKLEEKEIQWHISLPENSIKENDSESYFEQELINQFGNHLLITDALNALTFMILKFITFTHIAKYANVIYLMEFL
ncbi:9393_t:CDS:2 [Funneliformis caledonium]|uniref:9393_t:CDS:1 n=1 Tax=Funneliformis caledonium TaxID=1117310 RepID=A0A9N9F9M3_9GLOM|nr:9393_t:CDS:2 [Funneliformis caledonium]